MRPHFALAALLALAALPAQAQNTSMLETFRFDRPSFTHKLPTARERLVLQVSDDRPELWQLALNNAHATQAFFGKDKVRIVVVAYGPGLKMLFKDSAAAARIAEADAAGIEFDACNNTLQGMAKALGHTPELQPAAVIVPAGVVRIMQLEKSGFEYVRP